jgi:hypothetical protein
MIRTAKKIQLLEWGIGTNTLNQIWSIVGEGKITRHTMKDGLTTLQITLDQPIVRKSEEASPRVKLTQQGEGMAGGSDRWGEVALGYLRTVQDGGRTVIVEILTATKLDTTRRGEPSRAGQ